MKNGTRERIIENEREIAGMRTFLRPIVKWSHGDNVCHHEYH